MSSTLLNQAGSLLRPSVVILLICSAAAGFAQQPRFEDVTEVVVVEVPVQVLVDGEPVRDLTAADFEIQDGRKKRDIIGFDVVDLTILETAETPTPGLPGSARRHFLLLFDLSFSDPAAIVRARQAATELVQTGLHPSDLVAVASYGRSSGTQLLLGFTPDRAQVGLAINTLALPQLVETRRDPLGLLLSDPAAVSGPFFADETNAGAAGVAAGGIDPDAEILELLTAMDTSNRRASDRNEILALTSALTGLADMMRAVDGKKYVVFLSEGFNSSILLGTGVSSAEEQRAIQEQNQAAIEGRIWDVDSDARFGETSSQNQLEAMLREFVRADCTIQAVDIGGVRAAGDARPRRANEDGLFMMANNTGGDFYRNFNDLNAAMTQMLERTSVTYLLAFQPQDLKFDGEFHKLKVKLRNGPKGARVVHRPGYFSPRSPADLSPAELQLTAASQIFAAPGGAIDTAVLAAAFNAGRERAYVPVLIEVGGPSLLVGHQGNLVPTEIYAYAIGADGRVQDFFSQSLRLDLSKVGPALEQSGLKLWGQFELPPGRFTARVMVRNGASGATGVDVFSFEVPDFDRADSLLLAPLFPEPVGKWLLVRQEKAQQSDYDYPFMLNEAPFIPAARPVVRSGEQVQLSLVAYNLEAVAPDARGTLFAQDGSPVGDVEIVLQGRSGGDDLEMQRFVASWTVPELDAGVYRLQVTLGAAAAQTEAASSIPLRIAG